VKKLAIMLIGLLSFGATLAQADMATEKEVTQSIVDSNAYVRKNLQGMPGEYSKDGAVEFWSSGGLMQEIPANTRPEEFVAYNVNPKHIRVTTVVPGQVAVAHFYAEGSMQPKGGTAVSNYRTRVSQVFVKEDGKWKIRASHWSPITGGAGTSQTALDQ
jgi:hypothetical protein